MTAPRASLGLRVRPWLVGLAVTLLLAGSTGPAWADDAEDPAVKKLRAAVKDGSGDKEKVRLDLLSLIRSRPGTPASVQAAEVLGLLPSPLDALDPENIPELDRFPWQPKELVAVMGEHRGRQGSSINCIAYGRDGKRVVSGGNNGLVRIWDSTTLRELARVGTGSATLCVALSRDDKWLVAGNSSGSVYVWDVSTEKPVAKGTFAIATTPVYSVDITPDNKLVAAGVGDGVAHILDLSGEKPAEKTRLPGHKSAIRAVAWAPGSKLLATTSNDGELKQWLLKGEEFTELPMGENHPKTALCLEFAPSGKILAAGLADGNLWFWNVTGGKPTKRSTFKPHNSAVTSLSYYTNGQYLATGSSDATAKVWNLSATPPRQVSSAEGHIAAVNGVAWSPDGKMLATGSADWTVRLWSPGGAKAGEKFPPRGHLSRANSLKVAPDTRTVASGSEDRTARVWDTAKPTPAQYALFKGDNTPVYAVSYSPDSKNLATGGASSTLHLYDAVKRSALRTFPGHPTHISFLSYTADGDKLLACSGKEVWVWNEAKARVLHKIVTGEDRINALALSWSGEYALTGFGTYDRDKDNKIVIKDGKYVYKDCNLRLWDLQTGRQAKEVLDLPKPVLSLTFTPEGKHAAICLWDETIKRWEVSPEDIKSGDEIKTGSLAVHACVFSPDGKRLATVGRNGQLVVVDPATGKVVWQWSPGEPIANFAFSPDCRYLAVSIQTGPVYVLRLAPPPDGAASTKEK